MKETIAKALSRIEEDHQVRIILAIESGSRAWGFPSRDSDFDVRFIYVHQQEWYLSIADKRDVIELPVDPVLDINGWDLKKALQLMRKSNAPLFEWLASPIQYSVWPEDYLAMAKSCAEKIKAKEHVKLKTYMYAIRPVLCCQWIIDHMEQPPMRIDDMLSEIKNDHAFKDTVVQLIGQKKEQTEKDTVKRSDIIEDYIHRKIVEIEGRVPENPQRPNLNLFDDVFKTILQHPDI